MLTTCLVKIPKDCPVPLHAPSYSGMLFLYPACSCWSPLCSPGRMWLLGSSSCPVSQVQLLKQVLGYVCLFFLYLYSDSSKCRLATNRLFFLKYKILHRSWFSPPWTKKIIVWKRIMCSIKDFVATLISCATSKFRKLDDWPHAGGENLIIAAFGTPVFLH